VIQIVNIADFRSNRVTQLIRRPRFYSRLLARPCYRFSVSVFRVRRVLIFRRKKKRFTFIMQIRR